MIEEEKFLDHCFSSLKQTSNNLINESNIICKSFKITQYLIDIRNFLSQHRKYIQK